MGLILQDVDIADFALTARVAPTISRGSVLYFDIERMNELIECCIAQKVYFLGVEGFVFEGQHIIPDINWIADFSGIYRKFSDITEHCAQVRKFLEGAPKNLLFECLLVKYCF